LDIIEIARKTQIPMSEVIDLYFTLSERFDIDRLLVRITGLPRGDRWTALARQAMRTDLYAVIAELALRVGESTDPGTAAERVRQWESSRIEGIARTRSTLDEILSSEDTELATISVALRVLRNLVAQAG
jgi:glutamate dehydrogenase